MKLIKGREPFDYTDVWFHVFLYALLGAVGFGIMYLFLPCALLAGASIFFSVLSAIFFIIAINN